MTKRFDGERGAYLVILNTEGQLCLWPDFLAVPERRRPVQGPSHRGSSTAFIDARWTRPRAIVPATRDG
jgi:MbtH protein